MRTAYKKLWVSGVAFLLASIGFTSPSFAGDYEVSGSSASQYSVGQTLAKDATINVPKGKSLRLLATNGDTHTIKGPFTGTIAEYLDPSCPPWKRMAGVCKGDDKVLGGSRGESNGEKDNNGFSGPGGGPGNRPDINE